MMVISSRGQIGEWPISQFTDINAVCDLIKSWFRVLPGGLFPPELYGRILGVTGEYCPNAFMDAPCRT